MNNGGYWQVEKVWRWIPEDIYHYWRTIKTRDLGKTWRGSVFCPVCGELGKITEMDCHHMIPKSFAAHLANEPSNLVFLHYKCHYEVHKSLEKIGRHIGSLEDFVKRSKY